MALLPLLLACVLDRTGQSASSEWERELALHAARAQELDRRLSQIEEVTRYRGQLDAGRERAVQDVQVELRQLRGEVERLAHTEGATAVSIAAFQDDAAFRLGWTAERLAALERALGIVPLDPNAPAGAPAEGGGGADPGASPDATPEELAALAASHVEAGRHAAARAVYERLLGQLPADSADRARVAFLHARTWFDLGEWQAAVLRLEDVITADPKGPFAGEAMVLQGECFSELGKDREARLFWEEVVSSHPGTPAAARARELLGR